MSDLAALALVAAALAPGCAREPAPPVQDAAAAAAEPFDHTHALWTQVLEEHVDGDRFDYAALHEDPSTLERYLGRLHAVTPDELAGWSREERFAFWINVYNAETVARVLRDYPLDSIKDLSRGPFGIRSVFDEEFVPLQAHHPEGDRDLLSLNDVEHGILRARFPDARLHAAVNCASVSCPPLRGEAFVASRLDEQLDEQMRAFVRDERRNRLDRADGALRLSKIFEWFAEDFERDAGSVRAFVLRYLPEEDRAFAREARLRHLDYDWSLNDLDRSRPAPSRRR